MVSAHQESPAGRIPSAEGDGRLRDELDRKIAAASHRRTADGWRPVAKADAEAQKAGAA